MKLFTASTRPAAIVLLSESLNQPEFVTQHSAMLHSTMQEIENVYGKRIALSCPLSRVQDHICMFVRFGSHLLLLLSIAC